MSKALQELEAVLQTNKTAVPEFQSPEEPIAPAIPQDRWKAIEAVTKALNKQFKTTTSVVRLGNKVGIPWPSFASGLYTLDHDVIGTGGIPKGRIVEIYGPESCGKTTLALWIVSKVQKSGGIAAFIDAEHALDPTYASKLGVDVDNLLVAQPDSGEQALDTLLALVRSRAIDIAVVDSVAALVPQAELDGDMGDSHVGLQPRLMSQAMRKLRGVCDVTGIPVIFINQIREKVGVMFGSPEVTTGGRALRFYASLRLDIRKIGGADGLIKSGDVIIGHKSKIKAVKNKVAAPFRETFVDLIYGVGYDEDADFTTYAVKVGAIQQNGAWFSFNGEKLGQGLEKTIERVKDSPELRGKIILEVKKAQEAQRQSELQRQHNV